MNEHTYIIVILLPTLVQYLQPLINGVLHLEQSLLPGLDTRLKRLDERGAPHCLGLNDLIIKVCLNVIHRRQNGHTYVHVQHGI